MGRGSWEGAAGGNLGESCTDTAFSVSPSPAKACLGEDTATKISFPGGLFPYPSERELYKIVFLLIFRMPSGLVGPGN